MKRVAADECIAECDESPGSILFADGFVRRSCLSFFRFRSYQMNRRQIVSAAVAACAATANYRPRLRQNGTSSSQKSPSRCRFDAFFAAGRVFPVVFRRYPIAMPSRVSSTVPSGSGGQSSGLRAMVSAGSTDTKKSRGHYPTGFFRKDLAGVVGFEPTSGGFRIRCLNRTWRYPSPDMVRSERLELS